MQSQSVMSVLRSHDDGRALLEDYSAFRRKAALYKKLFILSSCLIALLIAAWSAKRYYYKQSGIRIVDWPTEHNNEKNAIFNQLHVGAKDIVLLGNSITEGVPSELFDSLQIKNRGISGNRTEHILGRLAPIVDGTPAMIFLEVGINDLAKNIPQDTIISNFSKIIDMVRLNSPHTQLYIQSVLPTCGEGKYLLPAIRSFNPRLEQLCKNKKVAYIDMYEQFEMDDQMNPNLTTDGTHLNYTGYLKYTGILKLYMQ